MCVTIMVNNKFCEGIDELAAEIGRENIVIEPGYERAPLADLFRGCLCPLDAEATAKKAGFRVKEGNDNMDLIFVANTARDAALDPTPERGG